MYTLLSGEGKFQPWITLHPSCQNPNDDPDSVWQRHFPNTTEMCLNLSQVSSVGRYTLLIRIWPHLFITGWKVGTIFGWFQPTETNWIKFKMWITFFHLSSFDCIEYGEKWLVKFNLQLQMIYLLFWTYKCYMYIF